MSQPRVELWALFLCIAGCGSSTDSINDLRSDGGNDRTSTGAQSGGSGASNGYGSGGDSSGLGDPAAGGSASGAGASGNPSNPGAAGDAGTTGAAGAAGLSPKIPVGQTQCSDGIDNDGDGLIDSQDPECTGPLDNDESSFATGIPGDNVDPKWQDCFFDGNSGGGDDGCRYSTGCLTGALAPTDKDCQVSDKCRKNCMPLTPNGCDCFGCCEVTSKNGNVTHVMIDATCTYSAIGDPAKCPVCTPSAACDNTCDHCELCLGKTSLPADCAPSTGGAGGAASGGGGAPGSTGGGTASNAGGAGGACVAPACDAGQQPCGVDCLPSCPAGDYCLTGCCVPSIR